MMSIAPTIFVSICSIDVLQLSTVFGSARGGAASPKIAPQHANDGNAERTQVGREKEKKRGRHGGMPQKRSRSRDHSAINKKTTSEFVKSPIMGT